MLNPSPCVRIWGWRIRSGLQDWIHERFLKPQKIGSFNIRKVKVSVSCSKTGRYWDKCRTIWTIQAGSNPDLLHNEEVMDLHCILGPAGGLVDFTGLHCAAWLNWCNIVWCNILQHTIILCNIVLCNAPLKDGSPVAQSRAAFFARPSPLITPSYHHCHHLHQLSYKSYHQCSYPSFSSTSKWVQEL